jgi:hypothetical protein
MNKNTMQDEPLDTLRKILLHKAEYWRTKKDDQHTTPQAVSVALMEFESALSETQKLHPEDK